ncbi:pilus assembly protein PilY [Psychrobacter sp. PAMC 21119]|uniref:pilus assembly protein PilY n=1 Tax=Psychrobacter sp. PAMC 21119 TaxID=1112209 RepID=UPI0002887EE2|nr:pilus assembly protein PilY [Psychrobacter sp. PAMC 21119]
MKRLTNVSPISGKVALPLKYLVVAMATMTAISVAQADVAGKKIGDLEIYKAAESGKTTVTMMLDTSGSMTMNQVNYACDLPGGSTSYTEGSEMSDTNPAYIRNYCETGRKYYYRYSPQGQWYRCGGNDGSGDSDYNFAICGTKINTPTGSGFRYITSGSGNQYYYKFDGKFYDRLTRLKDAIFTLMDSTQLDPKKVAIGIGQFSSQSGDDNVVEFNSNGTAKNADGSSGKILVPAALLDDVQRQKIRNVVAAAAGGGGTPTANAYAEVGAYMLGTNTSGKGSGFSKSITSSKSGSNNYISPLLKPSSCDGRGIYFLTDGAPNSSEKPLDLMKQALNRSSFRTSTDTLPSGSSNNNGMPEVGSFAKALNDSTASPLGTDQEIYTAVVGFGSDFNVDRVVDEAKPEAQKVIRNLPYTNPRTGITKNRDFYNCANIVGKDSNATKDARNACNWGEKAHPSLPGVGGFGEGGFYSAQSTDDIVNSIISFVTDLDNTLPSVPSGTIIIPDDPYRADSQLAVAYYPTLQPNVGENKVIWEGNLKKYTLNEGTLYGKSSAKLFKNIAGDLDPNTQDMWSDKNYTNANGVGINDKVESGGFYAQLSTPATGVASVRTLYVEDLASANGTNTVLRRVGVNGSGKMVVDGAALTSSTFKDTTTYNETTLRKLLNFLGFDTLPSTATLVKDMTLKSTNVSGPIKVLGASIHSTPAAVSYSATLNATTGRVTDTRDDYVLFGSSEGGLHLVDADNQGAGNGGEEEFVIIPREMLRDTSKSDALVKGATKTDIGSPNFGIDAPWLVTADYNYDLSNNRVNVNTTGSKGVFAYGGLRMGGEVFYGLNLNNINNPSMIFAITPATSGFSRMGQIWGKPTKAKIKTSSTDTGTDVLVFGGGYDMCYEYEAFQVGVTDTTLGACSNKTSTKGNAVYIINARTGALIWSASAAGSPSKTVASMTNSIVAGVTTLDRNNDGFMDHIYFADLGGQIFRADFTNAGFVTPVTSGTASPETSFTNRRVTRVLKSAYTGIDAKYNYRFYERPVVSFYRNDSSNSLFALVNAISGDRSSPLSKIRDNTKADRLYGIIDSDVTKLDNIFYASNFTTTGTSGGQTIVDLDANNTPSSNLAELPSAIGTLTAAGYTLAQKNVAINILKSGAKQGWYYPLTRFDGYGNVRYSKGIGKSEVVDSFIYTTVYNPDMSYGAVDSCSAKVTGGSERQLYCLPYGICTDNASKNGTAGYVQAGKGIQELTLGPLSSSLSNQRLLIGTRTLTERANDRVSFGSDGDKFFYDTPVLGGGKKEKGLQQNLSAADQLIGNGTAPDFTFNERYTLQPKVWYEVD